MSPVCNCRGSFFDAITVWSKNGIPISRIITKRRKASLFSSIGFSMDTPIYLALDEDAKKETELPYSFISSI
jgi:hypothetical protein